MSTKTAAAMFEAIFAVFAQPSSALRLAIGELDTNQLNRGSLAEVGELMHFNFTPAID
jgi:hypothetical protein